MISISEALEIVAIFLTTEFEGSRYRCRTDKIELA